MAEARLYYPDSIRARYGRRGDDFKNAVHGSETRECAEKEIHFFFPDCEHWFYPSILRFYQRHRFLILSWRNLFRFFSYRTVIMEPLLKDEMAEDYLWEVLNPILVEALSMVKMRNDEIFNPFAISARRTVLFYNTHS